MSTRSFSPKDIPTSEFHQYLVSAVAPRPIAFVSTVDEHGQPNLAPYSFFNAFSSNPPTVIFSANRRVRNNTTKDTLHNVTVTREAVINMINHDIVYRASLASCEYTADVNEFVKAGLTPLASDLVKPYRVAEAPVQMECIVKDIISLGEHGGAGNLIICEVVRFHVQESVLNAQGKIDQDKIDLMGRMGRSHYVRASGAALETIHQPVEPVAIGYDALPKHILESTLLTAQEVWQLASATAVPAPLQEFSIELRMVEVLAKDNYTLNKHHALIRAFLAESNLQLAVATAFL